MNRWGRRCLGAAMALAVDRLVPEPSDRAHPVAWFGTTMGHVERRLWADRRAAGVVYAVGGLALGAGAGAATRSTMSATQIAIAGDTLRTTATEIGRLTEVDLDAARAALPSLVGREPSGLDVGEIRAAVVESLAENMVDAVVAPVFWAVVAGPAGALGYRAVNTMDAMVGHHSARYERFGWAAARLDDAANWIPARIFALLVVAARPARRREIAATVRRDAGAHPSPNAGVAEAAMAGAIGRRLGGPLRYGDREERRPTLGTGDRPDADALDAAVAIADRTEVILAATLALAAGVSVLRRRT
ncbi:MAG: CobD/CbiB family cobalamin biosynthesis protein [Actinomycetota bacterium]